MIKIVCRLILIRIDHLDNFSMMSLHRIIKYNFAASKRKVSISHYFMSNDILTCTPSETYRMIIANVSLRLTCASRAPFIIIKYDFIPC